VLHEARRWALEALMVAEVTERPRGHSLRADARAATSRAGGSRPVDAPNGPVLQSSGRATWEGFRRAWSATW
jgi:hypothetical protein